MNKRKMLYRLLSILIGLAVLYSFGFDAIAQDDPPAEDAAAEGMMMADEISAADVQYNLDQIWILLAGFLVFFMQAGFAMLEGGMIRETGGGQLTRRKLHGRLCDRHCVFHCRLWHCLWRL